MHTTTDLRSALDVLAALGPDGVAFHVTLAPWGDVDMLEAKLDPSLAVVPAFEGDGVWLVGDADTVGFDVVDLLRKDSFLLTDCSPGLSFGDCSGLARTFRSLV